jgi:hypothetical protein
MNTGPLSVGRGGPDAIVDANGSQRLLDRPASRQRPHLTLKLRPEPGVEPYRALRGLLKIALRSFGLCCLRIEEAVE